MPDNVVRPEDKLLAVLLRNPQVAPEVSVRASFMWFESPLAGTAFDVALNYACENQVSPTRDILLTLCSHRDPDNTKFYAGAIDRAYAVPHAPDEFKHVVYYCDMVERAWKARTAEAVMIAAAEMLDKGAVDDAVESLQRDIKIPLTKFSGAELMGDFGAFLDEYNAIKADPSRRFGIPIGFRPIDDATRGHFPGELIVMVGGPGVGKSLFLGQVAVNVSVKAKKRVLLITVENNLRSYQRRLYSNIGGIPYDDLKTSSLTDSETAKLMEAIAALPEEFCLKVVHMEPPCTPKDILNIMRAEKHAYDYLIVDQITNMAPNHPKDFQVMDWRWYSQIALELRTVSAIVYNGKGIPTMTAVHAAGGTTDKKELTTDDTALAKSIGYHADGMLFFTRKDGTYLIGKSKYRDAHFDTFEVFPVWENWTIRDTPPQQTYGQTVDDAQAAPAVKAQDGPDTSFDSEMLEAESLALSKRDLEIANIGETIPDDFVPEPPKAAAPPDSIRPEYL